MLRAYTKLLSDFIHLSKNVKAKDLGNACIGLDETSEHWYGGCLSSTIVTKQGKYLSIIHGQINIVDSCLVTKLLDQSSDFQALLIRFLSLEVVINSFEIPCFFIASSILL